MICIRVRGNHEIKGAVPPRQHFTQAAHHTTICGPPINQYFCPARRTYKNGVALPHTEKRNGE